MGLSHRDTPPVGHHEAMSDTLTPGAITRRWGTSDSAIRRALKAGKFPGAAKDDTGTWRIPLTDVLTHLGPEPVTPSKVVEQVEAQAENLDAALAKVAALEASLAVAQVKVEGLEAVVREQTARIDELREARDLSSTYAQSMADLAEHLTPLTNGLAGYLMGQTSAPQPIEATSTPTRRWWPWSKKSHD